MTDQLDPDDQPDWAKLESQFLPIQCAPDGQHCFRCNGVHGTNNGHRTFVTSLTWSTDEDDEQD